MATPAYDVAIGGLGPVGCMAAILLAHAGLRVIAVERDKEVYRLPRAVNLDGEIVRAFQPLGLADKVDSLLQKLRPGDRAGFTNSKREWLFGQESKAFGPNGWQPGNMFDQPELEGFLRDTALASPNVTAMIGCDLTGFEDGGDQVMLEVDGEVVASASYLIGCDGASSFVRKQLGFGWRDLGYNHEWLVVDVIALPGNTLTNEVLQVCSPDRIETYVATKDPFRRWEFKLNPGETREEMLDPEKIASLIDPWTPRGTYEVRRAAVYEFHAATADEWRKGRVLIAGDAAHQTPPFLGQGMNSGMRDVINLAWKLPLVLSGAADDALLDTYHAERDAHAHDLVDWAVSLGRLMEHLAATEQAERDGKPAPAAPEQLQSAGYGQGRDQPPVRAGAVMNQQLSDTGSTGYLFRQPIVRDESGKAFRLDDLLGPGFAIVGRDLDCLKMSAASQVIADKLNMTTVSLEGLIAVEGHLDQLFEGSETAIVRPDRLVFGHTSNTLSLDDLMSELALKIYLT